MQTSETPGVTPQPNGTPVTSEILDRGEAARYLRQSTAKLAQLTATGEVPSFTIGRRRLYRLADLRSWIDQRVRIGSRA